MLLDWLLVHTGPRTRTPESARRGASTEWSEVQNTPFPRLGDV